MTKRYSTGVSADQFKLYYGAGSSSASMPTVTVVLELTNGTSVEKTFVTNWSGSNAADPLVWNFGQSYSIKGIYTNELDTNLYCVPFVVVDGEIFYCPVITWNLLTEMETFAANNELSAEEIAVFEAMLALHDDTMAYRATVD